ncbi:hypothetical protein Fuma_04156 [Fuerstiella marisgermanici]|uniref:Uncharacterized protein n=1 Tax=Fuerstiella marisgermanici TaxID=1891926 RepID=A0A1P8WKD4_9PLAN|nr:hypothetical protein Fuma_04156 [Fuerstiella marisgermanici]
MFDRKKTKQSLDQGSLHNKPVGDSTKRLVPQAAGKSNGNGCSLSRAVKPTLKADALSVGLEH